MSSVIDTINAAARKVPAWTLYILLCIPIPFLFYQAQTGGLGPEPINALEREIGELSLKLIILGLAITPLRKYLKLNLLKFRRAIGVMAFVYVAVHLGIWVLLDMNLRWGQMWADIWKRPYITIGMAAFVIMLPLAMTSNNWSVRKLGKRWRVLHKATYLVGVLGGIHFLWVRKGFQIEPLLYLLVIVGLLALRAKLRRKAQPA